VVFRIATIAIVCEGVARGQAPPQIEDILKVWESRQGRLKSLRAEWTEEVTTAKGSVSKQVPFVAKGETLPPEDFIFQSPVKLRIADGKIFYQRLHHQWESSKNAYFDIDIVQAFDGETDRHLTGKGAVGYPAGVITKEPFPDFVSDIRLRPFLMHFRPLDPK